MLREDGFLGPYGRILVTGNTQHMCWDLVFLNIQLTGPFWIYDMVNSEHRHDFFTGNTKPRKLNQNELIYRLHIPGVVANGCNADIVRNSRECYITVVKLAREERRTTSAVGARMDRYTKIK